MTPAMAAVVAAKQRHSGRQRKHSTPGGGKKKPKNEVEAYKAITFGKYKDWA